MKKVLFLIITIFITTATFAQNDDSPLTIVEKMPSFPGGNEEMAKFITKNIEYPKAGFSGANTCYITFVVERDGSLTDVKTLRGAQGGPPFDEAAIKVVQMMPKWIPGTQNGNLVRVQFYLPIKFKN